MNREARIPPVKVTSDSFGRVATAKAKDVSAREFMDLVGLSSPEERARRNRELVQQCIAAIERNDLYGYPPLLVKHCRALMAQRAASEKQEQCEMPQKGPPRAPASDRFWSKVDRRGPDECWPWTAARNQKGYGKFSRPGHNNGWDKAHRIAWQLANGSAPDTLCVLHRCDNPACVNPAHLFEGDHKANGVDCSRKGRGNNQYGGQQATHCINGHEYTAENTYWRPTGQRDCRTCIRERVKKYKQKGGAA